MVWRVQIRATQSRSFWVLLRLLRRIRFEVRKRVLLGSEKYVAANTSAHILLELMQFAFSSLLFAFGTATLLLLVDLYFPIVKWGWVPFPLWYLDDRDSYATFLSTISAIGGVLIGLYYTGLASVSSAAYVQAPGVLRSLLLREPVGRFYIRLLAYTTFVALCLLAFFGVGFSPLRLAVPLLVFLSGLTILSFVHLGQHAFYFFDPTRLGGSVFLDFERWVKRATVDSRFWDDSAFQNHAHQQADAALEALSTLADYSSVHKHLKTTALADLGASTIGMLYRYAQARQLIPSESKWYPSEYEHPDFYAAGDLKVQVALQTGGSVQPVMVAQSYWVEETALPVIYGALRSNLDDKNEASVFRLLDLLRGYVARLGELWEVERAMTVIGQICDVIKPVAFSPDSAAIDAPRWRLGLVEYMCLLPISLLLGFVKSLETLNVNRIRALLVNVKWNNAETLYKRGFATFALPTLEWFRPRLVFETMAEQRVVTPDWFVLQGVAKDYLTTLHKATDVLLQADETLYRGWHGAAVGANHPWAAAVALNRQGEYIAKLQTHLQKLVECEKGFESAKVIKDMVDWPSTKMDKVRDRLVAIEQKYEIALATEARKLVGAARQPHVPDFAGEFLSRTAQTVLETIIQNNTPTFRAIFPEFFQASIEKTAEFFGSAGGGGEAQQIQRVNLAIGPLLDLVELSGFAIIASQLRESPDPWNTAKSLWDQYLLDKKVGEIRIKFLWDSFQTAEIPGLFAAGELLRTNWRMRIHTLFEDLSLREVLSGSALFGIHRKYRVQHDSDLVKVLARETFPGFYRGIDVFVAMYLVSLSGNEKMMHKLRAQGLIDALLRESRLPDTQEEAEQNEETQD